MNWALILGGLIFGSWIVLVAWLWRKLFSQPPKWYDPINEVKGEKDASE